MWQAVASQPFNTETKHAAPRKVDDSLGEFWLANPWEFEKKENAVNLSMYERNRLYMNQGSGSLADASYGSGVDLESDTRAVAVGDLNEDGRPDMIIRNVGGGPLRVYMNRSKAKGGIRVTLRGTKSNSEGIGAQLYLEVGGRVLYREHFPQNSMIAQSANETIFGLGEYEGPVKLKIRWPSGIEQVVEDLERGRVLITEPAAETPADAEEASDAKASSDAAAGQPELAE